MWLVKPNQKDQGMEYIWLYMTNSKGHTNKKLYI